MKIEAIIKEAVNEGIKAGIETGRRLAERTPDDAYKATERRLRALPVLKEKLAKDKDRLEELQEHGLHKRSNDVIRFQRSGRRVSDEDILAGIIQDLEATIAATEFEIKTIEDALAPLTNDPHFLTLSGKFFDGLTDDEIAKEIHCDPRTVRRNRGRLMNKVVVWLYGVDAI